MSRVIPLVLLIACLGATCPALGQEVLVLPDPALSSAEMDGPATVLVLPDGSGPTLASQGAAITVTVLDPTGTPVPGFPAEDIYLHIAGTLDFAVCQDGTIADGPTDANGRTTFTGALLAGGSTFHGLQVYLSGMPLVGPSLPLDVVSCDMNGDLTINLVDVANFAQVHASGSYHPTADFFFDGRIDLADIGTLALHLGAVCP